MSGTKLHLFVSILLLALLLPLGLGAAESAPLSAGETVYTVQRDDNLWSLAEKYLGNGTAYTAIVEGFRLDTPPGHTPTPQKEQ